MVFIILVLVLVLLPFSLPLISSDLISFLIVVDIKDGLL